MYNRGPEKRLKLFHDVALVHTKEEFKIAPNVNPICLPDSKEWVKKKLKTYLALDHKWKKSQNCLYNDQNNFPYG